MKRLLCFSFLLLATVMYAQEYQCHIDEAYESITQQESGCNTPASLDWNHYRDMYTYIPYMNPNEALENQPIKTIDININIIQKDDGSENFPNTPETVNRFKTILGYINGFYTAFAPSDPISWVNELPKYDSRIRFSLGNQGEERIYFYQNSALANSNRGVMQEYLSNNYPDRLRQLNIYIFCNSEAEGGVRYATATMPSWTNYDEHMSIVTYYWSAPASVADWANAGTLAHELGHTLGLRHTYYGGGCSAFCDQQNAEYIKDIFLVDPPTTSNCPHTCDWGAEAYAENGDGITNNLMGGNKYTGYISPVQAGQLHRSLALSSSRKYAASELCGSRIPIGYRETC